MKLTDQIKHRHTGEILCGGKTLGEVLEAHKLWVESNGKEGERAELEGADLRGSYLRGANLRHANLECADLQGANLQIADLRGADLQRADLRDANLHKADLREADLREANLQGAAMCEAVLRLADLRGANLRSADMRWADLQWTDLEGADLSRADLTEANLTGANFGEEVPIIENIHQKVYEAASQEAALDMKNWHTCDTTHCRAGWVVTLAGEAGKALEDKYGTPKAASLIYAKSDPNIGKMPNFYCYNETALDDMKARAEEERECKMTN